MVDIKLTTLQARLLRRGLVPSGIIRLSADAPLSEAAALRLLAAQGLVRRGLPNKNPPRPGSWFLTDAGREVITTGEARGLQNHQ
jgi:hypothetical protein